MDQMRLAPTKEFIEAYHLVTGSEDTSPAAILNALRDEETMFEIRRVHRHIMLKKISKR